MHLVNATLAVVISWLITLLHTFGTSAIWVSLEGCYKNIYGFTDNHTLFENNGPRHCFGVCPNSRYIGLQDIFCLCDTDPRNRTYAIERVNCNYACRGEKVNLPCGSSKAIYVYQKETRQVDGIYGEYGNVYVHVSWSSGIVGYQSDYHATNNTHEKHKFLCYDGANYKCDVDPTGRIETWEAARNQCFDRSQSFLPYPYDNTLCQSRNGDFWIGVIWLIPAFIVTTSDTTTATTTSIESTSTITETTYIPSTVHNSSIPGNKTHYQEITTVPGKTEKMEKIDADVNSDDLSVKVAVPIVCVFLVAVASFVTFVTCWKKEYLCFKPDQERKQVGARINGEEDIDSVAVDKNTRSPPENIPIANTPNDIGDQSVIPGPSHTHTYKKQRDSNVVKRAVVEFGQL